MKTRIFELRNRLNLTQTEFGEKIGLTRNAIAAYERGNANPTGTAIMAIVTVFHVNREWLETGEGEMFAPTTEQAETAKLIESISDSPAMRSLLATWAQLSEENKAVFERFAADYVDDYLRRKAEAKTARIDALLDESEADADISDNQSSVNHA